MSSKSYRVRTAVLFILCVLGMALYVCLISHSPVGSDNIVMEFSAAPRQQNSTMPETRLPQDNHNCSLVNKMDLCSCRKITQVTNCTFQMNKISETSTCSSWAKLRGPGQKVVSYSLFGKFPSNYSFGMEQQLPRVSEVYPGWVVRLYLDLSQQQQKSWACALACKHPHLDICDVHDLPGLGDVSNTVGTAWRFSVVGDPFVERYIVRDTDSPIIQREVDAVHQWIQSGKCFHVMRDNPSHGVSMLGGTWGGCNTWQTDKASKIRTNILNDSRNNKNYYDQPILWVTLETLVMNTAKDFIKISP